MADTLIAMIDREASNARAGRAAGITAKMNGLSDPHVVRALLRAASDGVRIDLVCRGICTLRPGVPGISDRIRVVSNVGRFLEHSRAYRFENGGEPVHFIGSADLRHRNLRRRVELLVPLTDRRHNEDMDRILGLYLDDPCAWHLGRDGEYTQGVAGASQAQVGLMQSGALNRAG
jgi:polyphosphate kinase